ncbi:hypothetical protein RFI_03305, partial [Reticulomyxa filosa]
MQTADFLGQRLSKYRKINNTDEKKADEMTIKEKQQNVIVSIKVPSASEQIKIIEVIRLYFENLVCVISKINVKVGERISILMYFKLYVQCSYNFKVCFFIILNTTKIVLSIKSYLFSGIFFVLVLFLLFSRVFSNLDYPGAFPVVNIQNGEAYFKLTDAAQKKRHQNEPNESKNAGANGNQNISVESLFCPVIPSTKQVFDGHSSAAAAMDSKKKWSRKYEKLLGDLQRLQYPSECNLFESGNKYVIYKKIWGWAPEKVCNTSNYNCYFTPISNCTETILLSSIENANPSVKRKNVTRYE